MKWFQNRRQLIRMNTFHSKIRTVICQSAFLYLIKESQQYDSDLLEENLYYYLAKKRMGSSQSVENEKAEAAKIAEAFLFAFQSHYLSSYSTINIARKYATGQLQPHHHNNHHHNQNINNNNNNNNNINHPHQNHSYYSKVESTTAPASPSSSRATEDPPIRPSTTTTSSQQNNNKNNKNYNYNLTNDSSITMSGVSDRSVHGSPENDDDDDNGNGNFRNKDEASLPRLIGTSGKTIAMLNNNNNNNDNNQNENNNNNNNNKATKPLSSHLVSGGAGGVNSSSTHSPTSVTSSVVTSPNLLAGCPLDVGHHSIQLNLPFDARNWWIKKIASQSSFATGSHHHTLVAGAGATGGGHLVGRSKSRMYQNETTTKDKSTENKKNKTNDDDDDDDDDHVDENEKKTTTRMRSLSNTFVSRHLTRHSTTPLSVCPEVLDLATASSNISVTHRHRGILLKLSDYMKQFNNRFIALQRDWKASLWEWEEHFRNGDQPRARIDLSIYANGGVVPDATEAAAMQLKQLTTLMRIDWDAAPESENYPMRTVALYEARAANNIEKMTSRGGSAGSGSVILQFGAKNEYWKQWVRWLEQAAANCSPYGILDDAVHAHAFRHAIDCAWNDVWRIYKPSSSSATSSNNNNNQSGNSPSNSGGGTSQSRPTSSGTTSQQYSYTNDPANLFPVTNSMSSAGGVTSHSFSNINTSSFGTRDATLAGMANPSMGAILKSPQALENFSFATGQQQQQQPRKRTGTTSNNSSPASAGSPSSSLHNHQQNNLNVSSPSSPASTPSIFGVGNEFEEVVPPFPRHGGGELRMLMTALYHLLKATVFTKFVSQRAKEVAEQNKKQKEKLAIRERERELQQERERKKMMMENPKHSSAKFFDDDENEIGLSPANKEDSDENNKNSNDNVLNSPLALKDTLVPTVSRGVETKNDQNNNTNNSSFTSPIINIPSATNNNHNHHQPSKQQQLQEAHQRIKEQERILKGQKRRKDDAQWTALKPYCDALEKVILEVSARDVGVSWNTTTELVKKRNIRFDGAASSELRQAGDCWRHAQERSMNLVGRCPHLTGVSNIIKQVAMMKISSTTSFSSGIGETNNNFNEQEKEGAEEEDTTLVMMLVRHFTKAFSKLPESLEDVVTASTGANAELMAHIIAEAKRKQLQEEEEEAARNQRQQSSSTAEELQQQQQDGAAAAAAAGTTENKKKFNIGTIGKQIIGMRKGLKTLGKQVGDGMADGMNKFSTGVKDLVANSGLASAMNLNSILLEGEALPSSNGNNNNNNKAEENAASAATAGSSNTSVAATARKGSLLYSLIHRGYPVSFLKAQEELISGIGLFANNNSNNNNSNHFTTTQVIDQLQRALFAEFGERSSEFLIRDPKCRASVVDWANRRKNPYLSQTIIGRVLRLHSLLLTDACYTLDLLTLNAAASRAKNQQQKQQQQQKASSSSSPTATNDATTVLNMTTATSSDGNLNKNQEQQQQQATTTSSSSSSNISATILEHGSTILSNVESRLNHTIERHVKEAVAQVLFGVAAVFWEGTVIRWSHRYVQTEEPDHFTKVGGGLNTSSDEGNYTNSQRHENDVINDNDNDDQQRRREQEQQQEDVLSLDILEGEKLDVNFAIEDCAYDELLQLCRDTVTNAIMDTL